MDENFNAEYEKLQRRLRQTPFVPVTPDEIASIMNLAPRRVRESWRVDDDLMFGAGYAAWLATGGPDGRA